MPYGDHELLASDLLTDCSEFHDILIKETHLLIKINKNKK